MSEKLRQLFQNTVQLNPSAKLVGFILARIEKEKIRTAKRQLIFSYVGLVGSAMLATYTALAFGQTFLQSEFWAMLSLAFSDVAVVMKNWDSFGFSLLETFPTMHAATLILPVFLMLVFANFCFTNKCKYNLTHKYNH